MPAARPKAKRATSATSAKKAGAAARKAPGTTKRARAPAAKAAPKASAATGAKADPAQGSAAVDERIRGTGGWKGETLARLRRLVGQAVPDVEEDVKWRKPSNPSGVVVWSRNGILATGETYKDYAKVTFAHGAALPDPKRLFNAGLAGGTRRAIDLREGEMVDAAAFKDLVRAAAAFNASD